MESNPSESIEILEIAPSLRAQLPDGFEFGGVQTFYRYLLPELHPFPCSKRHCNRRTRLEIAGEVAFEIVFALPAMRTGLPWPMGAKAEITNS